MPSDPPRRQPRGKWMVSLVNSHTNATRIGWHLWEIDLRFAPGLPPGWPSDLLGCERGEFARKQVVAYSSPICCTSCIVKSLRSRGSSISSPLWTP